MSLQTKKMDVCLNCHLKGTAVLFIKYWGNHTLINPKEKYNFKEEEFALLDIGIEFKPCSIITRTEMWRTKAQPVY